MSCKSITKVGQIDNAEIMDIMNPTENKDKSNPNPLTDINVMEWQQHK